MNVAWSGKERRKTIAFHDWVADRGVPALSTNAGAAPIAFQSWRNFKEAFAPELIFTACDETGRALGRSVRTTVDPFGGSGTTALASQFLGCLPTTIEVNPYLADLIEAKLTYYDFAAVTDAYLRVLASSRTTRGSGRFEGAPATFVEPGVKGRWIFDADIAEAICRLLSAIDDQVRDSAINRLLRVLCVSAAVGFSNVVVSGKGRRYRRGWKNRDLLAQRVETDFRTRVEAALYDIRRHDRPEKGFTLLRGDARSLSEDVGQFDLAVFSPPYPNSFDYTDVYNVELWVGGYLKSAGDNRDLRERTLRSHVQIARPFDRGELTSDLLDQTIDQLDKRRPELWNRHIPDMVGAYFADMMKVIGNLARQCVSGGRLYMVVGDSRYAGVSIPVATILTQLCQAEGLELVQSSPFRSMRASPQQGGEPMLPETLIVLCVP